jgi:hypothetical protein
VKKYSWSSASEAEMRFLGFRLSIRSMRSMALLFGTVWQGLGGSVRAEGKPEEEEEEEEEEEGEVQGGH